MAIGGSPTSRRITAWHHTCCNTVRWSGQRICDLCGTQADYYRPGVPIGVLMERLHSEDKPGSAVATPPQSAAIASPPAPAAGTPAPSTTRPLGARPHRDDEENEARASGAARAARPGRWSALHTMWLAGAIAQVWALEEAASADHATASALPMLLAVAAILLVVLVPMTLAGHAGEAAR